MDLKRGLILAILYLIPFWVLVGPPALDIGHALMVPIYFLISLILTGVVLLIGAKFFDLDIMPWGLVAIGAVFLSLIAAIPLLWYLPAIGLFVAGILGD